jgi:hypothetical protein
MASSPLVSIVVPTYNCERHVAATLASVLAQKYRPIEVIVVDDGSSDSTPEIVSALGEPVQLVRQSNHGVCRARNAGFERSRGEYVCFLDHDDHWFDWKLSRQVEAFTAQPEAGVVFTAFEFWHPVNDRYPEPSTFESHEDRTPSANPTLSGWIYHQFLLDCWALTSTAMIRRDVFAASGGFDPTLPYSEDWDLWLRLSRTHPFVMLDRVSTLYRQHPGQGSRTVRDIDYRTRLLWAARRQWGLASPDGRAIDARTFARNIARYHMQFGLHHLHHGSRSIGIRALSRAWRTYPAQLKYAALCLAAIAGWTPQA